MTTILLRGGEGYPCASVSPSQTITSETTNTAASSACIVGRRMCQMTSTVEKWYRDAKLYQIWEGTNEIQRLVISPALLGS